MQKAVSCASSYFAFSRHTIPFRVGDSERPRQLRPAVSTDALEIL